MNSRVMAKVCNNYINFVFFEGSYFKKFSHKIHVKKCLCNNLVINLSSSTFYDVN